ncbi:MAG: acyltransferase [Actinomycetota bacterium]|nr:acyltransferase [Actinomycetota bacterium]
MITLRPTGPSGPATQSRPDRDRYIDFLRAASLLVVVGWHWLFSIVTWHPGPGTSNPIGTTPGLWAFTWVLQVMPLFFFVGGFAHLVTWESVERAGGGYRMFVTRRLRRLVPPTVTCVGSVGAIWALLRFGPVHVPYLNAGFRLVLSPLWFLAIYVGLVLVAPAAIRLHRAAGTWALVGLAAGGAAVDIVRFHGRVSGIAWLNMVLVWGFAHQLGFSWRRLVAAPRRLGWALLSAGLVALAGLTTIGGYPRSMVGVPGEAFSNMGPPTACILALILLQVGVVLLARRAATAWLARPRPARLTAWAGARSMTVYLWHFPAFAVAYALVVLADVPVPQRASLGWWLERPLWLVAPAAVIVPCLRAFRPRPAGSSEDGVGDQRDVVEKQAELAGRVA